MPEPDPTPAHARGRLRGSRLSRAKRLAVSDDCSPDTRLNARTGKRQKVSGDSFPVLAHPGIPQSVSEAQQHIAAIRTEKGVDNAGTFMKDLGAAMDLLSTNLYHNRMHFIMELIQNSDDNSYAEMKVPRMTITYKPGCLRIDTNEIGFSKSDVEAICSIGQSTKVGSKKHSEATGEKGVGFKSVFGVSDRVFITSGHYSFMFSNTTSLDRLAPTWAEFPESPTAGHTTILLYLYPDWDAKVAAELQNLDATVLLFLRQLQEINVCISPSSGPPISRRLARQTCSPDDSGLVSLTLYPNDISHVVYHHAFESPVGAKWRGQSNKVISLAFPSNIEYYHSTEAPAHAHQQVYAYLPIRDYGFKFVIQADFILTANREDIELDSDWNAVLLKELPSAVLAAVSRFNASKHHRYTWLRYVPFRYGTDDFFGGVRERICELLSQNLVLESSHGQLVSPRDLVLVPAAFQDDKGVPLIPWRSAKSIYVSQQYPAEATDAMLVLGIRLLTPENFLLDLAQFIQLDPTGFRNMPLAWHSRLCQVLSSLDDEFSGQISALPIVALRDDRWVSLDEARGGTFVFPSRKVSMAIPRGIDVFEISQDAAKDPYRRAFFQKAGATVADPKKICHSIVQAHGARGFRPERIGLDELVYQMEFLFRAGWISPGGPEKIWVAVEEGKYSLSPSVYLSSDDKYSMMQLMQEQGGSNFHYLHPLYAHKIPSPYRGVELGKWLQANFDIMVVPRLGLLVNPEDNGQNPRYVLHPDFRQLMANVSSEDILQLLRTHWQSTYTHFFKQTSDYGHREVGTVDDDEDDQDEGDAGRKGKNSSEPSDAQESPGTALSNMLVPCCGGSTFKLRETCLRRPALLRAFCTDSSEVDTQNPQTLTGFGGLQTLGDYNGPPMLDIPDPENDNWDFLEYLGVAVTLSLPVLIQRLRQLQFTGAVKESISNLYDLIVDCLTEKNSAYVRESFQSSKLIFIPRNGGHWCKSHECVWEGPSCLSKVPRLAKHYPKASKLFRDNLRLPNAFLKHVAEEACLIEESDPLDHIKAVLFKLSSMLQGSTESERNESGLHRLRRCRIFPIQTHAAQVRFDYLAPAHGNSASGIENWYIADIPHLWESFCGRIPLLAIPPSSIRDLGNLLRYLHLDWHYLSKAATKEIRVQGPAEYDAKYTRKISQKARFISRLIPAQNAKRFDVKKFRDIRVYEVGKVSVIWKFQSPTGVIHGTPDEGRVKVEEDSDGLKIYLIRDDLEAGLPPIELVEELSALCGIESPEHTRLLAHILTQSSHHRIQTDLEKRGFGRDIETLDQADDDDPEDNDDHTLADTISNLLTPFPSASAGGLRSFEDPRVPSRMLKWRTYGLRTTTGSTVIGPKVKLEDDELQFVGELQVFNFLKSIIAEKDPCPSVEWTSPLRKRAGLQPYVPARGKSRYAPSTFLVNDTSGRLNRILSKQHPRQRWTASPTPTFHVHVTIAEGSADSSFGIPSTQVDKAEALTFKPNDGVARSDVFLLALVYDMARLPQLALIPDPWQFHKQKILTLCHMNEYEAWMSKNECQPFCVDAATFQNAQKDSNSIPKSETYVYKPLNRGEIRILDLQPGEESSPLEGSIRHVDLKSPGSFTSISYVWGREDTPLGPPLKTPEGTVRCSFSLGAALRAARKQTGVVSVWADAMCIDQQNSEEKVTQILQLKRTFQSSKQVLAWLGHESDDSTHVINTLKSMGSGAKVETPSLTSGFWNSLDVLLARDWFRRAWIVQELVLPEKVTLRCGAAGIDWERFFEALRLSERGLQTSSTTRTKLGVLELEHAGPAYALDLTRQKLRSSVTKYSLLELLGTFPHTLATKERDKLFSLLGLASDSERQEFVPDYSSSLETVVRRYASAFVNQGQVMDLLYRSGTLKSCSFSSWIPNWTRVGARPTISTWKSSGKQGYCAGPRKLPQATTVQSSVLVVSGILVDQIACIDELSLGNGAASAVEAKRRLGHHLRYLAAEYPTGEASEDIILKLFMGDAFGPQANGSCSQSGCLDAETTTSAAAASGRREEKWPANLRHLVDKDPEHLELLPHYTRRTIQRYWDVVQTFLRRIPGAKFCITKSGYVGIIPGNVSLGDPVCVLDGGAVPFVLRKNPKTSADQWESGIRVTYTLLGECYVHGIMHGEAVSTKETNQSRLFHFT